MSLLMDALRKAEEAKSKASNKEQDQPGDTPAPPQESDNSGTPAPSAPVSTAASLPGPDLEQGPVTINPDPDEAETLASHEPGDTVDHPSLSTPASAETSRLDDLTMDDLTLVEIGDEDTVQTDISTSDSSSTENTRMIEGEDDDNELSLLQSSYFSRTQRSSNQFGDPELSDTDKDDEYRSEDFAQDFPEGPGEPLTSLSGTEQGGSPETDPELVAQENQGDAPGQLAGNLARKEEQERERAKRSSAGAVFLAKEDTRKRRLKRLMSIAAALLVIPLAGGMVWFYTSLNSTPQVQFNVPAGGGLADRGFLGGPPDTGTAGTESDNTAAAAAPENGDTAAVDAESSNALLANIEASTPEQTAGAESPQAGAPAANSQPPQVAAAEAGANVNVVAPPQPPPVSQPAQTQEAQNNAAAIANNGAGNAPGNGIDNVAGNDTNNDINNDTNNDIDNTSANDNSLSFEIRETRSVINPDLNAAYDSYRQGDFAVAGRLYQQVLGSEPNNRDAMLGLASVYLKQDNIPLSQNLYARLLELNPRDPIARAGLLDSAMRDDPVRQETELKSLVTAYPGIAPLSFALGNLYASQNRWSEAQSAYFNALLTARSGSSGPVSPDYAFNLAVSLERLNQLRTALDYYREAEEFSQNAAPGFDSALLNQRLNYLEQRLQ